MCSILAQCITEQKFGMARVDKMFDLYNLYNAYLLKFNLSNIDKLREPIKEIMLSKPAGEKKKDGEVSSEKEDGGVDQLAEANKKKVEELKKSMN
jgi:hypothetical protein